MNNFPVIKICVKQEKEKKEKKQKNKRKEYIHIKRHNMTQSRSTSKSNFLRATHKNMTL